MKKQLLNVCVAFAATLFLAGGALAQHEAPNRSEEVKLATDAIVLDGVADEDSWGPNSNITELFAGTADDAADFSAYAKLCYDATNLYLFVSVTDQQETSYTGTGDNYTFDNVEFFQDLDTSITGTGTFIGDETQGRFNRSWDTYTGNAARNDATYEFFETNSASGWTVEATLPWVAFMADGSVPEDMCEWFAKTIGFDLSVADNDGSGREGQFAWDADTEGAGNTEDNAWHDTRVFGLMTFANAPACTTSVNPVTESEYKVYPNPATGVVNFNNLEGVTSIEIVNVMGQVVKAISTSGLDTVVTISDLKAGQYFAKIYTATSVGTQKFIVQ